MADPHIRAAFYLSPTLDALWRWGGDGEVLTWPDDTTIAFRPEVEAVLRRVAAVGGGGLPPFGAVALLLAACRDGWPESRGRATIAGYARAFGGMNAGVDATAAPLLGAQLVSGRVAREVERLLDGLDAVHRLPKNLREGVAAKSVLAETVLEAAKNRSTPADAALVLQALDDGVNPETLRPRLSNEEALSQFATQVDGLSEGLARVDADALARRAATGLDQPVEAPGEDLSPPERVRRLLAGLRDDPELAGLARLAQDLMAAVSVPRTLRTREELAVGGVSDLTNRGPLDRLLVSELAHDDLTLAVRVAVNEALYLRRESPPREPPHRRAILIDAGIHMWGVPRVFAAAAALALAATSDPKAELRVYRAAPKGVQPVNLTTRGGLEAHLAALEAEPHPGGSLQPFFDALDAESGDAEHTDAVVITHADVLPDPEFLNAAHNLRQPAMYVATVARDGAFRLLTLTKAGKTTVREAKLSLDAILRGPPAKQEADKPKPAGVPLVAKDRDLNLPAILFADPFPLLLPHVADPKTSAVSNKHGLVAATGDGRLLHWRDGQHGARQLTSLLPQGTVRLVRINDEPATASAFLTRRKQTIAHLVTADLKGGRATLSPVELRDPDPGGVFTWAGVLYLVYPKRVDAFDLTDGRHLTSLFLPDAMQWRRERFFSEGERWFAIAYDGSASLKLEPVIEIRRIVMFDREGHDGPWALRQDGALVDPTSQRFDGFTSLRPGWRLLGVSPDGHRLAASSSKGNYLLDLKLTREELRRVGDDYLQELLAPQIYFSTRSSFSPRNRFRGVFVASDGKLALRTNRNDMLVLSGGMKGQLVFVEVKDKTYQPSHEQRFTETRRSPAARFKMHAATWNDGSRAWLDSRGLLHLKSSDADVPELSVVLSNNQPAAWSSEGKVHGPKFFIGDAEPTDGAYFLDLVRRFVARLR